LKRGLRLYLDDILDAATRIEEYTKDLTFERFCDDRKTVDVVVRNFEIIGEATKRIPTENQKELSSGSLAHDGWDSRQTYT
jgi:uncharacterized protein with HEPN domain